jgi:SAM-dependent methyltransferase
MSATGRSKVRDELDRYDTPAWCVDRLLDRVSLPHGWWLEPCCGSGSIIRAVARRQAPGWAQWTALDIEPRGVFAEAMADRADFLTWTPPQRKRFRVSISNYPYKHAYEFARKNRDLADIVVALLRLNWLESEVRAHWLRCNKPDVYVLPNRPSFNGRGTDATAYGWFVWGLTEGGHLDILDTTPVRERRRREWD